jgi:tetratricopeptide (TPR) repeat protein
MKKIVFILSCVLLANVAWAQKGKVNAAQYALSEGKTNEAKQAIDEALTDAETQQNAKAWQLKGDIYKNIYEGKVFFTQTPNALEDAKAAYLKAYDLEINPKKKGVVAPDLELLQGYFYNEGLSRFQNEKWAEAYMKFNEAMKINEFLMSNNLSKTIDTGAYFATAISASNGGMTAEAKPLWEKLAVWKYNNKAVYETLVDIYDKENNPAFLATLNEGLQKFPDSKSLQVSKLNYYMAKGQTNEAIAEIQTALNADPNNVHLLFNMAVLKEQLKDYDEALKYYDKAIVAKNDYMDAYFNAGALYFNKAIEINKVVNADNSASIDSAIAEFVSKDVVTLDDIKAALKEQNMAALLNSFQGYTDDNKNVLKEKIVKINESIKFDLLIAKRDALFNKALPYFEKAYSIDKNNSQLKNAMREIYARMNRFDKVKEME